MEGYKERRMEGVWHKEVSHLVLERVMRWKLSVIREFHSCYKERGMECVCCKGAGAGAGAHIF